MKRPLLLRLVERLYVWLYAREQQHYIRQHPEWYARVKAAWARDE